MGSHKGFLFVELEIMQGDLVRSLTLPLWRGLSIVRSSSLCDEGENLGRLGK